MIIPHAKAF